MDAWTILIKQTRTALLAMAPEGTPPGAMADAMKATLPEVKARVEAEWADAVDAHLSEGWLRELMIAQAAEWALEAKAHLEA